MKAYPYKRLALVLSLPIVFGGFLLWITSESERGGFPESPREEAIDSESSLASKRSEPSSVGGDSARSPAAVSFTDRLEAAASIADPTRRRLRQAEVLAEWIEIDFRSAFAFLEVEGFRSVSLPGIAQLIASRASLSDLVTLTNRAESPADALMAIGRHLKPVQLLEVANATHLIEPDRIPSAAGVLAGLIATQNLDSALSFAARLPVSEGGATAYAGIIDQLSATNSAQQARELFATLPQGIRSQDPVLFAYGNAVRDIDPDASIAALSSIHDGQYRTLALVAFSRKVEASSPGAAIQAIVNGLGERGFENHVPRIVRTWGTHDSAAARSYVEAATWMTEAQRKALLGVIDSTSRAREPAP